MAASYTDLKKIMENSSFDSQDQLEKFDFLFQEIITENQNDLISSLDLVEGFLVSALESKKSLKSAA